MSKPKNSLFALTILFVAGLLFPGCGISQNKGIVRLNNEQFSEKMKAPDVVILDVRTPEEYMAARIEGSVLMNVLDKETFRKQIKSLDASKTFLVYCRSGNRSMTAANILADNGFKNIFELERGIAGWKGPVVSDNPK